jgi:membrane-associated protease RseP (regulator of RpoE activity)
VPNRPRAALAAAFLLVAPCASTPVRADNPMGYRLLSEKEAARLPRHGGSLGMDVDRAQRVTDSDLTFDLMRVEQVRRDSPAARAGFEAGDEIIAVDGQVFATIAAFAASVGSTAPGSRIEIDYIPAGGGPQQAQRVMVTAGRRGQTAPAQQGEAPAKAGLSTGQKLAIGTGAAAVIGCYWMGCFSHGPAGATPAKP